MSTRELRRAEVLARVKSETLRLVDAAKILEVSYRQAKRLWQRYREEGAKAITSDVMVCPPSLCYRRFAMASAQPVGDLLREWRQRRRLSQLELSCDAEISTRHLSFLETGRSQPSREMVLHLAAQLDVPLRERNVLLVGAGYAPIFPEHRLTEPALENARKAVDLVLTGHEPYPALAIPASANLPVPADRDYPGVVVPFELITESGLLAFFSTTTVFGTPVDITLSELALEAFFPANSATAEALRKM
jgi:transcriptional regulator with XRE-family HTH domain